MIMGHGHLKIFRRIVVAHVALIWMQQDQPQEMSETVEYLLSLTKRHFYWNQFYPCQNILMHQRSIRKDHVDFSLPPNSLSAACAKIIWKLIAVKFYLKHFGRLQAIHFQHVCARKNFGTKLSIFSISMGHRNLHQSVKHAQKLSFCSIPDRIPYAVWSTSDFNSTSSTLYILIYFF